MSDAVPKTLSPIALEYVQWYITPEDEREPQSQTEWCLEHEVAQGQPSRWRRSPAWDGAVEQARALTTLNISNVLDVVEKARTAALGGDVQAMKTYLQYAETFGGDDDDDIRGMSDAELASALESAAVEVRARSG